MKKEDVNPEVYKLYDEYAHNVIDRKQFFEKMATYAVGGVTVASLMSFILPNYKDNVVMKADDERLDSSFITYNSPKGGGEIKGLLSKPKSAEGKLPGIIVVHENRGLNPYIEDVGRRAAVEGFISIAPDALSPLGGYPGNDDDGRAMQSKRDRNDMLEDFIAAYDFLKNHPDCDGNIGVVGFCFGGWISNMMAVRVPGLKAAVPYYGTQPNAEETAQINAPLLIHYAELDKRVNAGWTDYEAALKAANKTYEVHFYEGVNHGFHNNSTPRFDKEAADLSWGRTIDFFKEKLA